MTIRDYAIQCLKDEEVKEGEITGEPVFDRATELSRQCEKQWEVGSLRMVSVGIDILETSEAPETIVAGQTAPTITKSRIFETSIVDIGANDNAIVMRRHGRQITLGRDSENPLPELDNKPTKTTDKMELKTIALKLGLPETADEAAILAKIGALQGAAAEVETLREEKEELTLSQVTSAVEAAIRDKRLAADKKEHFVNLGKAVGIESLRATLDAMPPAVRLSSVINTGGGAGRSRRDAYSKLSEVPEEELRRMRADDPGEYRRLYKAEYGHECEI